MSPLIILSLVATTTAMMAKVPGAKTGFHANFNVSAMSSNCMSGNFRPKNGQFMPQADKSPFTVDVTSPSIMMYRPGQLVTVQITIPAGKSIRGFFLHGDNSQPTFGGKLTCDKDATNKPVATKVTVCGTQGMTHVDETEKTSNIVCKWNPPSFSVGKVQFSATIVVNRTTFYTGVLSEVTLDPAPNTQTYEQKQQELMDQAKRQAAQYQTMLKNMMGNMGNMGNMMGNMMGNNRQQKAGGNAGGNNMMANMMKQMMGQMGQRGGNTAGNMGGMGGMGGQNQNMNAFTQMFNSMKQQQQGQQQQNNWMRQWGNNGGEGAGEARESSSGFNFFGMPMQS